MKRKSIWIEILGISFIVSGAFGMVELVRLRNANIFISTQIYFIAWNIVFIVVGIGLFRLERWARAFGMLLVAVKTVQVSLGTAQDAKTIQAISADPYAPLIGVVLTVMSVAIGIATIYYLTRRKVKEQFIK